MHIVLKLTWNNVMTAHMLGHNSLNKFKTEIISSIFFDHNDMKWEINYKKKDLKITNR